jgi:hypothetical protein
MSESNLLKVQSSLLQSILNPNNNNLLDEENSWKILIFDTFCQNLLTLLFKVGNLRDHNITLHLNID